jgi:hypothetical protein
VILVDPGVSAPTGDPDSLLAAASWHENLASHFETTVTMLQFTRGSLSGENWSGEAASSYQDLTGLVIGHFSRAAMTASAAAAALRRYGSKLLLLQQEGVAAVEQVVHWMTVRAADQKKLEKAQADVTTAQNAVSGAQSSINSYVPHGGPGAVTAQVNAQAQHLRQAQAALETAQTAERAAQKAVDHDDQQVLAWQTKARLVWHEAQNEAALATGSLVPLEVPPPPLAGAPATFTNTLADDAPFLAANPQLTDPFARTIAAANAKKNHLSSSDENNDVQTILNALNSGKNLNDVTLSVPHHSGGGLFSDILAGIAVGGTEIIGGGPEDPAADAASVAEVAAIEGTADTVAAATAGADATDAAIDADAAASDAGDAASGGPGIDRGDGRDPLGRFTGKGGYGADKEAQGLQDYSDLTGRDAIPDQVQAKLPDSSQGRFYDGLALKPDGTYEGIEVKSGTASRDAAQRTFDGKVSPSNPATARLGGTEIKITSVRVITVP